MKVIFNKMKGTWRDVANSARNTIGLEAKEGEVSSEWKRRMLIAEHSPIRQLTFKWCWKDLLSWVSVHFVRHKIGIEHWVSTQRTDRTGKDRNLALQSELVSHEAEANAQAIINTSRKRLCECASKETRLAWVEALRQIAEVEPELASCCVAECIYRGFCPEYKSCGFAKTEEFQKLLKIYRSGINGN
jgi:hypothetical protein